MQISPTIMVSNHPGKVIVVFFDGHGDKVNTDTMYPQCHRLPASRQEGMQHLPQVAACDRFGNSKCARLVAGTGVRAEEEVHQR